MTSPIAPSNGPSESAAGKRKSKTFTVVVTQEVEVTIDPAKFDKKFMREFREQMYPFFSHADHARHIAQLAARGLCGPFIEGYGPSSGMGIEAKIVDQREEIE